MNSSSALTFRTSSHPFVGNRSCLTRAKRVYVLSRQNKSRIACTQHTSRPGKQNIEEAGSKLRKLFAEWNIQAQASLLRTWAKLNAEFQLQERAAKTVRKAKETLVDVSFTLYQCMHNIKHKTLHAPVSELIHCSTDNLPDSILLPSYYVDCCFPGRPGECRHLLTWRRQVAPRQIPELHLWLAICGWLPKHLQSPSCAGDMQTYHVRRKLRNVVEVALRKWPVW